MNYEKLSKRKQTELKNLEESATLSGKQYAELYVKIEKFTAKIDTPEKEAALKFLVDEVLEHVALGFQFAPIVESLDVAAKEINYREFKLIQELIKGITLKGRENLIRLSKSMKAFNEDGRNLEDLERDSRMFAQQYNHAVQMYAKMCDKYHVQPVDIDAKVDQLLAEETKTETETK